MKTIIILDKTETTAKVMIESMTAKSLSPTMKALQAEVYEGSIEEISELLDKFVENNTRAVTNIQTYTAHIEDIKSQLTTK